MRIVYIKRFYWLLKTYTNQLCLSFRKNNKNNTYIFHHIPRCGGTSLRASISEIKKTHNDYRMGWGRIYPLKYNLNKFTNNDCLSGHFELPGYHLQERYPMVFENTRYKLFTFVREPLDLAISYYYYAIKNNQKIEENLLDYLMKRTNYLASIFNVNEENYQQVLGRYDFIGLFEEYDKSLYQLQVFFGTNHLKINNKNAVKKDAKIKEINELTILKFKENNKLDYLIYNYCVAKFKTYSINTK